MAYATQFFFSFQEVHTVSLGLIPWRFRVSFLRDGFTGQAIELTAGAEPLVIETVDSPDTRLESVWPLKFTFELYCEESWQAESFFVRGEKELQVLIEIDKTDGSGTHYAVEHFGWVTPVDFKMSHSRKPFAVSVVASDGLAQLKTLPILDSAGKRLEGFVSLSHILRTALATTGNSRPLTTGVNLYEQAELLFSKVGNTVNPSIDPLHEALVRSDTLVTDSGDTQFGYTAIKRIVEVFGCRIAQTAGQWWVIRANEAAGGWDVSNTSSNETIHTRTYSNSNLANGPDVNSATSRNLVLNVHDSVSARIVAGGPVDILPIPKKAIKVEQSFGRFLSRLPNADFSQVDNTGLPVGWRRNGLTAEQGFRAGAGTEADPYRLVIYGAGDEKITENSPYIGIRIDYDPLDDDYVKSLARTFKGEFQLHNAKSAKLVIFVFRGGADTGGYLLQADGSWKKNPKTSEQVGIIIDHSHMVAGVMKAKTGWADISITAQPIDNVLGLIVYLCQAEALTKPNGLPEQGPPTPFIEYRNIRMEVEQAGQNLNGTSQIIALPGNKPTETARSLTLGDVPYVASAPDRVNTIFRRSTTPPAPTVLWYYGDGDVLGAIHGSIPPEHNTGKTLLTWTAEMFGQQLLQIAPTFEGTIVAQLPAGFHTVLRLLDFGEVLDGVFTPYLFQISRWKWYTNRAFHDITAERINLSDAPSQPAPKAFWQTPDGESPVNLDDDGLPVNPALAQTKPSFRDQLQQNLSILGIKPKAGVQAFVDGFVPLTGKPRAGVIVYNGDDPIGIIQAALSRPNTRPFR